MLWNRSTMEKKGLERTQLFSWELCGVYGKNMENMDMARTFYRTNTVILKSLT